MWQLRHRPVSIFLGGDKQIQQGRVVNEFASVIEIEMELQYYET